MQKEAHIIPHMKSDASLAANETNQYTAAAYEHCRSITLNCAKTFYFASLFLQKDKRRACYAVYAFCRYVDDLIDNAPQGTLKETTLQLISTWRSALQNVYNSGNIKDQLPGETQLVMIAWADTLQRYSIPAHLPEELIEGVLMDTYITRFPDFQSLYSYCYKVASVVGLMTSEIFGYSCPDALQHAIDLGIAMQLTNICRDIGEDAARGRIYLPQDELKRFEVTEQDILSGNYTPAFVELMKFQVERAHIYYQSADKGIPYLDKDSRLTVQLMSTNYRRILDKLTRMGYNSLHHRASLSFAEKLLALPRAYMALYL
jgi:phytoene synthase